MFRQHLPHFRYASTLFFVASFFISFACTEKKIYTSASPAADTSRSRALVNINTANAAELENLPYIGPGLAAKIVEHRRRYGPFRKVEHLLVIEGISHRRFKEIENLITAE